MARTRRSPQEKLEEKLVEINEAIEKYTAAITKMKEEKSEVEKELKLLSLESLSNLLIEYNMSTEDIVELINEKQNSAEENNLEQSA